MIIIAKISKIQKPLKSKGLAFYYFTQTAKTASPITIRSIDTIF